jgi:hypothetical protein
LDPIIIPPPDDLSAPSVLEFPPLSAYAEVPFTSTYILPTWNDGDLNPNFSTLDATFKMPDNWSAYFQLPSMPALKVYSVMSPSFARTSVVRKLKQD